MKYIIDIPDDKEYAYVNDEKTFLRIPISLGENETKSISAPTFLRIAPYTEPDRKAIEDEVWGFAQKVYEVIDDDNDIFFGHTYHEMKERYETWLKQKDKIRVGDEIVGIYSDGEKTPPLVVLKVEGNYYYGIYSKTGEYVQGGLNYEKTGRHFDEVERLLNKMRGEE